MESTNLRYQLPSIIMESFIDMRNAQPTGERLHYFDVALEGSAESNAILLQKLYTDILSKSNVDFGTIPDSQGVLTKYRGYKMIEKSLGALNELYDGIPCEEMTLTNKLHDMIISCRKDYELGYKFDVEIIKIAYCTSVLTLYEMINLCILIYTKKMQVKNGISLDMNKLKKKNLLVIKGAKSIIKSYESGQWAKMINEMKKDPSFMGGSVISTSKPANESIFNFDVNVNGTNMHAGNLGQAVKAAQAAASAFANDHPVIATGGKIVVAIIAVLAAIRILVYLAYSSAMSINDYVKTQKEFIDCEIKQEKEDGTSKKTIERHQKMANRLEGISNWIEVRILKTDNDTQKSLKVSNAEKYSSADFKKIPPIDSNSSLEF